MINIKILKFTFVLILISFFCTLLLSVSGYYQTELQERMILTQEAINAFEKDVKNGKDIDINNYLDIKQKNYDNKFTKSGRYLSKKLNNFISEGLKKTLKIITKAIEE